MSGESNHEPIEDAYSQQMNQIAGFLDDVFNGDLRGEARKIGFVLLVFPLQ